MPGRQFPVFNRAGRLEWPQESKAALRAYTRELPDQRMVVTVRPAAVQRSNDQNRWMWKCEAVLAEHLGNDKHEISDPLWKEEFHEAILGVAYGWKEMADPFTGEIRRVPARRTRTMSTREMSEHMDWFVRWCLMEHGCEVPIPPDDEETERQR